MSKDIKHIDLPEEEKEKVLAFLKSVEKDADMRRVKLIEDIRKDGD